MAHQPAATEEDRLNALQMADLGTARREHISTADDTRRRIQADLAAIERLRSSNVAGSQENELAERNRGSLDAWSSFHTTVTDTSNREKLQDLMQGQTHRAQLSATQAEMRHEAELTAPRRGRDRQGAGGHARARSVNHLSTSHSYSNHPHARPSSGRGGGIIGTISRHQFSPSPSRNITHSGGQSRTFDDFPLRQDPALDINNPGYLTNRHWRGRAGHHGRGPGNRVVSHASSRARAPDNRPRRTQPIEDYAARLTPPNDFMASIRAPSGRSAVAANTPSRQPQKTPKPAATPEPAVTSKPGSTAKPAIGPNPGARLSLDDSIYASPSSTPAASARNNRPGSESSARRIVPFEQTAVFRSRARADRSTSAGEPSRERQEEPSREQQGESKTEESAAVLLEFDQDTQESAQVQSSQAQLGDLLPSPGIREDLQGLIIPRPPSEDGIKQIVRMLRNTLEIAQQFAGSQGQQINSMEQLRAEFDNLGHDDLSRRVFDELFISPAMAPGTTRQGQDAMQPLSMATPPLLTTAVSHDERSALRTAGPSTPTPGPRQAQNISMPETEGISATRETDQASKTGRFNDYRTPQRSASASVTDSSDEKKRRRIDASRLSPIRAAHPSNIPDMQFESLRLSEPRTMQNPPKEPLSLIEMDDDPAPSEENPALTFSNAPRIAPTFGGLGPLRARAQRPTLVQSTSNSLRDGSARASSLSMGPRSSQQPPEKPSRAISGGMEISIWAHDEESSKPDPKVQTPPQRRPPAELSFSRQPGMQSTSRTDEETSAKVTFLGPAPYMPKRK